MYLSNSNLCFINYLCFDLCLTRSFVNIANWSLCPLDYILCDRWLQVAVTLCCHLSLKNLGRREPAVRFPLHLPVVPLHLWLIQTLLLTRYHPLGIPLARSLEGCRTPFSVLITLQVWIVNFEGSHTIGDDSCTSSDCHVIPRLAFYTSSPGLLTMRWAKTRSRKL